MSQFTIIKVTKSLYCYCVKYCHPKPGISIVKRIGRIIFGIGRRKWCTIIEFIGIH